MADPAVVAKAFTEFYYQIFDNNRDALVELYRHNSMFSFQDEICFGVDQIKNKLSNLPFQKVRRQITSCLAQPSINLEVIIVSVAGHLAIDDDTNPLAFSQVFQLVPENSTYYVHNDIFSLNVG